MDAITIKNYFISKGFLLADIKESYELKDEIADINFNIDEGKQFFVSEINSNNERLDTERYSQTSSHGMIPLSQ